MMNHALEIVLLPSNGYKHSHKHHQMVINISGMAEFELEGCGPGQIHQSKGCIIPSGSEHAFQGIGDNQMLLLNFNEGEVPRLLNCVDLVSRLFDRSQYFDMDIELKQLIKVVVTELKYVQWYDDAGSPLMQVLLNALARRLHPESIKAKNELQVSRVNLTAIDAWITNHLSGSIHVSDLASLCCLSVSQFHRRFHAVAGCSPYQYIMSIRVREAVRLLQKTKMPISDITSLVGFSTQSALCKLVKKQFDMTPSQIRGGATLVPIGH